MQSTASQVAAQCRTHYHNHNCYNSHHRHHYHQTYTCFSVVRGSSSPSGKLVKLSLYTVLLRAGTHAHTHAHTHICSTYDIYATRRLSSLLLSATYSSCKFINSEKALGLTNSRFSLETSLLVLICRSQFTKK